MDGRSLPKIVTEIPGLRSVAYVERLARTECPAITARRARRADETGVPQDPIVWAEARGSNVMDVDGNVYVDITSAFGVCGLGHAHPAVVAAAHRQADRLVHAMGDVYPADVKIDLCERLAELAPGDLERSILGLSGSSSIESALKTAAIHTGKTGVVAFTGGYHGLSIGALAVTGYKESFRAPFRGLLNSNVTHLPFPDRYGDADERQRSVAALRSKLIESDDVGAVLLEPIQGRGGHVEPPEGFLVDVRELCDEFGVVMILDEIFTGFGRTGSMFVCEAEGVIPDVLCVGKALAGGFPLSAAIGRPHIMDSWGASQGEAIHTQTFLGHPMGCAMALAMLDVLVAEDWPRRVAEREAALRGSLEALSKRFEKVGRVRGKGFLLALELGDGPTTLQVMEECRSQGYLVLPSGPRGDVLGITPPFVITDEQLAAFVQTLENSIEKALHAR